MKETGSTLYIRQIKLGSFIEFCCLHDHLNERFISMHVNLLIVWTKLFALPHLCLYRTKILVQSPPLINYHPALYSHLQLVQSTSYIHDISWHFLTGKSSHEPYLYIRNFCTSHDEEVCTKLYNCVSLKHTYWL